LDSAFAVFRRYYTKMKEVVQSRGDVRKFKDLDVVEQSLHRYLADHPVGSDLGVVTAKRALNIIDNLQKPSVRAALDRGYRSVNMRAVEMQYSNIVSSLISTASFLIGRGYTITDGRLESIRSSTIRTPADIARYAPLASVSYVGELSERELAEVFDSMSRPAPIRENAEAVAYGSAIAVVAGVSAMYMAKVLTYFYYYARVVLADHLMFLSEFLKNTSQSSDVSQEVSEKQLAWSRWFAEMAVKIDVDVSDSSTKAGKQVRVEVNEMETTPAADDGLL
jgi:hypothetical protein